MATEQQKTSYTTAGVVVIEQTSLKQEEEIRVNEMESFAYLQHVLIQLKRFGKLLSHEEPETRMPWEPAIRQTGNISNAKAREKSYLV